VLNNNNCSELLKGSERVGHRCIRRRYPGESRVKKTLGKKSQLKGLPSDGIAREREGERERE
jgi:hypothetical protein